MCVSSLPLSHHTGYCDTPSPAEVSILVNSKVYLPMVADSYKLIAIVQLAFHIQKLTAFE